MKYFTYLCLIAALVIPKGMDAQANTVKRVRINFKAPNNFVRPLLLGFTPNNTASDGFDYGYDGLCPNQLDNDLNFIIENRRCVIQGVGAFDKTKQYPLGMFIADSGNIEISLSALENFGTDVDVFIYDSLMDTQTQINEDVFSAFVTEGEYFDRFFIKVQHPSEDTLGASEFLLNSTDVKYLSQSKELYIKTPQNVQLQGVDMLNILGKKVQHWNKSKMNTANTQKLKLTNFATGSYIVIIKTSAGVLRKKIIVQR